MMRNEPLTARSFLPAEAAFVGYAAILGVAAFARWSGLIIHDSWLVPLVLMMGIQFVGDLLLGNKTNTLTVGGVYSMLLTKAVALLSVAVGFTLQRMQVTNDESVIQWGHWTMGAVIGWELWRFVKVLRAFDVPLGVLGLAAEWIEQQLQVPREKLKMQQVARYSAETEREAAKQELRESGEIKSSPAFDVIDDHSNRMTD